MNVKKYLNIALIVLLLSSIVVPVLAQKAITDQKMNWTSDIGITPIIDGVRFGSGPNAVTITATVESGIGKDVRLETWSPSKLSSLKTEYSRTEKVAASGFSMDFYVVKDSLDVKFDLYASQDVSVALQVSGELEGNYVFTQGRISVDLFDVYLFSDNFSYDHPTQTLRFTMAAGERIDPLITFNEVAGTYVYDSIDDYGPAVVMPAPYAVNQTLHAVNAYDRNISTLQDWLITTRSNYSVNGNTSSFEWILENLREETSPGLTDLQTNVAGTETCRYDEDFTLWNNDAGITLSNEVGIVVKGVNSTKIVALNNAAFNYMLRDDVNRDVSNYDFMGFWWYGNNSGRTLLARLFDGASFYSYEFDDDWNGSWRRFTFPLKSPDSTTGDVDLTAVKLFIGNQGPGALNGTWYFDRLVFDQTHWVPSEFYIGDNTTSINVYTLNSTGQDPRILFEWTNNGTTDASIYPGNLRNLEDEWLGSIAKQNATDWTIKANTTLFAPGVLGEFQINTSIWLPTSTPDRLCLPSDFVAEDLENFNPERTIANGNPWLRQANFGDAAGHMGLTTVNSGANIIFHQINNYNTRSQFAPVGVTTEFAWSLDTGTQSYTYEYYIDNDDAGFQNATIEVNIPDLVDIATYTLSYWNGTDYVEFMDFASGNITQPKSLNQTNLDAAMYLEGLRTESRAIVNATAGLADIANITYSNNYGVMSRFGFTVELWEDDGLPQDGADEIRLLFNLTYVGDGSATFEFNRDANQFWGIDDLTGSAIELFDFNVAPPRPYLILLTAQRPDALWVTSGAQTLITLLEFNATGNYKVLVDEGNGIAEVTASTGETIQAISDRWNGYYKNIAQFDRGVRAGNDVGEGDAGFGWTYTSFAGLDQKVAFKVPLAPWQNATVVDVDSGRSQMRLRAEVNMATPSTYSYLVDLEVDAQANFVLTLLSNFFRDSYNIGPKLPMKNGTVTFTDPRTNTPYNFTYIGLPGQTAVERQDVNRLTINGANVWSKVVPLGTITAGAGPNQNITVNLGNASSPVVDSIMSGNLTAVAYDFLNDILTVTMNRSAGQSTLVVDTGGMGLPNQVLGTGVWSYDAATDLITLTLTHPPAGSRQVRILWSSAANAFDALALNLVGIFLLVAIVVFLSFLSGIITFRLLLTMLLLIVIAAVFSIIFEGFGI